MTILLFWLDIIWDIFPTIIFGNNIPFLWDVKPILE